MEPTLDGWRGAREIVSRWVWICLKVGEPEGVDISSMSELVCDLVCPPETRAHRGPIFSQLPLWKGEDRRVDLGGRLLVVICQLWLVWGKQRRKAECGCQLLEIPAALSTEELGRCGKESMGFCLHNIFF